MTVNINGNVISSGGLDTSGNIINTPSVVTDGLVLWYDTGNNASYINSANYYDCGYGCQYYGSSPGCTNCNTQIKDMSGYGNDSPLNNGASVIYDNTGGYINFDGVNDNLSLSTTFVNRVDGEALTVGVWLYPGRTGGSYQDIIGNRSGGGSINWILYQHATDGSIQLHGTAQNKSSYIPTINTWIYVMATVTTGGVSTLYINGESQQVVSGYAYGSPQSLLTIGVFGSSSEPYLGRMGPIYIYNRALSSTEVLQNFNDGRQRFGI